MTNIDWLCSIKIFNFWSSSSTQISSLIKHRYHTQIESTRTELQNSHWLSSGEPTTQRSLIESALFESLSSSTLERFGWAKIMIRKVSNQSFLLITKVKKERDEIKSKARSDLTTLILAQLLSYAYTRDAIHANCNLIHAQRWRIKSGSRSSRVKTLANLDVSRQKSILKSKAECIIPENKVNRSRHSTHYTTQWSPTDRQQVYRRAEAQRYVWKSDNDCLMLVFPCSKIFDYVKSFHHLY
jgi:hypothetical protein